MSNLRCFHVNGKASRYLFKASRYNAIPATSLFMDKCEKLDGHKKHVEAFS